MNIQQMHRITFLLFAIDLSQSQAAEPIAEFDAARGIAKSGWTVANDKPQRAEVTRLRRGMAFRQRMKLGQGLKLALRLTG